MENKLQEKNLTRRGAGRPKGSQNKTTALLKDAILEAATKAGGKGGLVAFLKAQAEKENNAPFLALVGKVLPMQVTGPDGTDGLPGAIQINVIRSKG